MAVVSTRLVAGLGQNLHIAFHSIDGDNIYRIIIKSAPGPVYFNRKGGPRLYLRTGGGTRDINRQ